MRYHKTNLTQAANHGHYNIRSHWDVRTTAIGNGHAAHPHVAAIRQRRGEPIHHAASQRPTQPARRPPPAPAAKSAVQPVTLNGHNCPAVPHFTQRRNGGHFRCVVVGAIYFGNGAGYNTSQQCRRQRKDPTHHQSDWFSIHYLGRYQFIMI